ncbi:MAG: glycosyltransferase [Spirochaetes bacterium]|nr:glycosyltransferase [Spirochaetota bacterium]
MGISKFHNAFIKSKEPHILMITNHGIHQWDVIPGLQDTGGQNVFVNQFSEAIADFGFKVTIINRGGYKHPVTGIMQKGFSYRDKYTRIYYLEDNKKEFIRKEDMREQVPGLADSLEKWIDEENIEVDLIISHYWDAALIGVLYNRKRKKPVKHIWVPHSLGTIKKRNMNPDEWEKLRIDERIETEKEFIDKLDGIAATSSLIQNSLVEDYGYRGPHIFLPPCIDTKRYFLHEVNPESEVWNYLSEKSGTPKQELMKMKIVTEISRTDITKGKDTLIKAFAEVHKKIENSILVISIDRNRKEIADKLKELIRESGVADYIIPVGSIWNLLPDLYIITDVYCTPAVQEGFGMSAQEAAAAKKPVIASNRVPFVTEFLLGNRRKEKYYGNSKTEKMIIGEGAVQVPVGDVKGFASALDLLLSDYSLREKMGDRAYSITIPYFTWKNMVKRFLDVIGIKKYRNG